MLQDLERAILQQDPSLEQISARGAAHGGVPGAHPTSFSLRRPRGASGRLHRAHRGRARGARPPGPARGRAGDRQDPARRGLANARQGARRGVVVGRCWEAGGAPAFWPWVEACGPTTAQRPRPRCSWARRPDVAQILPELRSGLSRPSAAAPARSGKRAFRLFDSMADFLAQRRHRATDSCSCSTICTRPTSRSLLLLLFLSRARRGRLLVAGATATSIRPSGPLSAAPDQLSASRHANSRSPAWQSSESRASSSYGAARRRDTLVAAMQRRPTATLSSSARSCGCWLVERRPDPMSPRSRSRRA